MLAGAGGARRGAGVPPGAGGLAAEDYGDVRLGAALALAAAALAASLAAASAILPLRAPYALELAAYPPYLAAMRRLSRALGEPRLVRYGALLAAAGAAAAALLSASPAPLPAPAGPEGLARLGAAGLGSYLLVVAGGYALRRTYELLSERTAPLGGAAPRYFGRAARWVWLGSLLAIAIVGVALMAAGAAYAAAGYAELARLRAPQAVTSQR